MENKDKKYSVILGIMIFLFVVVLAVAIAWGLGYVQFGIEKAIENNNTNQTPNKNNIENKKDYKLEDYVTIEKQTKSGILSQEAQKYYSEFDFSKIVFKNIDNKLVENFYKDQERAIKNIKNDYALVKGADESIAPDSQDLKLKTTINAQINNNILSVLVRTVKDGNVDNLVEDDVYCVNIDLDKMKVLNNEELLSYIGSSTKKLGEKLLDNIESNVRLLCQDIPTAYSESKKTLPDNKKEEYINTLAKEVKYYPTIENGKAIIYFWDGFELHDKVGCEIQATAGNFINTIEL